MTYPLVVRRKVDELQQLIAILIPLSLEDALIFFLKEALVDWDFLLSERISGRLSAFLTTFHALPSQAISRSLKIHHPSFHFIRCVVCFLLMLTMIEFRTKVRFHSFSASLKGNRDPTRRSGRRFPPSAIDRGPSLFQQG